MIIETSVRLHNVSRVTYGVELTIGTMRESHSMNPAEARRLAKELLVVADEADRAYELAECVRCGHLRIAHHGGGCGSKCTCSGFRDPAHEEKRTG